MPWQPIDDLSTGLDLLYDEHDAQYCLVAAAQKAVITQIDPIVIEGLLSMVLHSVRTHSLTEGRLMQRYGFPGYTAHARRHDQLVEKAQTILDVFRCGREDRVADQLDGLAAALNGHIGEEDAVLQRHLLRLLPEPVQL
jgi:hemerythrin